METVYKALQDDYSQKNNVMLKQSDLAKKLGISTATISRLENGTYKKVATSKSNVITYNSLTPKKTYYFKVRPYTTLNGPNTSAEWFIRIPLFR